VPRVTLDDRQKREMGNIAMKVEVREEPITALEQHSRISIAFQVTHVLDIADGPVSRSWHSRRLNEPYFKDYDAIPGNHLTDITHHFDLSNWGLLSAWVAGVRVGGAVVAFRTAGLPMLEGKDDLAVLWDLRIEPGMRRQGIGAVLLEAAEAWARSRGCDQMKIETQNTNIPAFEFYRKRGYRLVHVRRGMYPELPEEVQLLLYKLDLLKP
jgi:ribosomal protein S18 acetylase RimI-like enzyme